MKKIIFSIASTLLVTAVAVAQIDASESNLSTLNQDGTTNTGKVDQIGFANASLINQDGGRNNGTVYQDGIDFHYAEIVQEGQKNTAVIKQFENYNTAFVDQYGDLNDSFVVQSREENSSTQVQEGNTNMAKVYQNKLMIGETDRALEVSGGFNVVTQTQIGNANRSVALQGVGLFGLVGHNNIASMTQEGNSNLQVSFQDGEYNTLVQSQIGDSNESTVAQTAAADNYASSTIVGHHNVTFINQQLGESSSFATIVQDGDFNKSRIFQKSGDDNTAIFEQLGDYNTSNILQTGNTQVSNVTQTGSGNSSLGSQAN
jgi:hypothetical protein